MKTNQQLIYIIQRTSVSTTYKSRRLYAGKRSYTFTVRTLSQWSS